MQNNHADRAKLFLSFDALKGFRTFLNKKERVVVDRKLLMSDSCDELDWKLHQVQVGKMIKIIYYDKGEYVALEGMVTKIDVEINKQIKIVDKLIQVQDIIEIEINGMDE